MKGFIEVTGIIALVVALVFAIKAYMGEKKLAALMEKLRKELGESLCDEIEQDSQKNIASLMGISEPPEISGFNGTRDSLNNLGIRREK